MFVHRRHPGEDVGLRPQHEVVDVKAFGPQPPDPLDLSLPQVRLDRAHDRHRDVILEREHPSQRTVVGLGPDQAARFALRQAEHGSDASGVLAQAAQQPMAHPERAAGLAGVDVLAVVDAA